MLFTHKVVNKEEVEIDIGGIVVQQARSANILGILIDDRLSFNQHMIAIKKKISCDLGIMYKIPGYVPGHVLRIYFIIRYFILI